MNHNENPFNEMKFSFLCSMQTMHACVFPRVTERKGGRIKVIWQICVATFFCGVHAVQKACAYHRVCSLVQFVINIFHPANSAKIVNIRVRCALWSFADELLVVRI